MKQHSRDYKAKTREVYNRYPKAFDETLNRKFHLLNKDKAERFVAQLPGKRILDIGAGVGTHALYFQQLGYEVLCGDYSEAMVDLCRQKGVVAEIMDIEALDLPQASFDGIWAYAVLLHVPKSKLPSIVAHLAKLLVPHGALAISLKEGEGEGFTPDKRYPEGQRFFSYFTDDEARAFFVPHFTLVHAVTTPATDTVPFLHYLFKKT